MRRTRFLFALALLAAVPALVPAQEGYTRQKDVIYGRKFGTSLTMDVFAPKEKANGLGVIFVVSGGWFSSPEAINPSMAAPFLKRGYTVFAVCHGCQPKYTVAEILDDMHRAVRYIRHHAKDYKIDPDRLGITGGSAGGHLSLMMGTTGKEGNKDAKDPVDRATSTVQAVACFFPPTDFLNYGKEGNVAVENELKGFRAALTFVEIDKTTRTYFTITDAARVRELTKQISPAYHVTAKTPPTLIVHGDADKLVPIQQAEVFLEKLKEHKVPGELLVRKGAAHGGPAFAADFDKLADWFDRHLAKKD